MGQIKLTRFGKYPYILNCLLLLISLISINLEAQTSYDISLSQSSIDTENSVVCFNVQLKSGTSESWELAGQNYRLYYDSEKASFFSGKSHLGNRYQSFKLIQDLKNVDASQVQGGLAFEKNIGFLNFAIDLLDPSQTASLVPGDETWLTTSEICFHVNDLAKDLTDFAIVWARSGQTDKYATSYVEVSSRVGVNLLVRSVGNLYDNWLPLIPNKEVEVKAKVFLQGAYNSPDGLMRDNLRELNYIPKESIYNSNYFKKNLLYESVSLKNEISAANVFNVKGKNAIVDWVYLELRDKQSTGTVVDTRSALLQRDGDIVDMDGKSPVKFSVAADAYYLVIRHRNHLGIMSKDAIDFTDQNKLIDFTDPQTSVYGEDAQSIENGVALMWGGNADSNEYSIFQGGGVSLPDTDFVFFELFSDESNTYKRFNHIVHGYFSSDLNMDGEIRYQGGINEIDDLLFFNIYSHPQNTQFFSNFFIQEQVPSRVE